MGRTAANLAIISSHRVLFQQFVVRYPRVLDIRAKIMYHGPPTRSLSPSYLLTRQVNGKHRYLFLFANSPIVLGIPDPSLDPRDLALSTVAQINSVNYIPGISCFPNRVL
jgi:hypothetical protein